MWGKIFSGIVIFILVYLIYSNLDLIHSIDEYEGETPRMNVQNFFADKVEGWGMMHDISGAVRSRFHINFNVEHDSNCDVIPKININILFDDGEENKEIFNLIEKEKKSFIFITTTFPQKIKVTQNGHSFQAKYILNNSNKNNYFSNTSLNVHCSLINKNVALCQGSVKKIGILLGKTFFTLHSLNYENSFNKN